MKKVLFLLVCCLLFGLFSCGKDESESKVSIVGRWNAVEVYLNGEKKPNSDYLKYYLYFEENKTGKFVIVLNQTESSVKFTWDENDSGFVVTVEDSSYTLEVKDLTKETIKIELTCDDYVETFVCNRYDEEAEKKKYIGVWEVEVIVQIDRIDFRDSSDGSLKFHLNEDGTGLIEIVNPVFSENYDFTWEVDDYVCIISVKMSLSMKYVVTRSGNSLEISDYYNKTDYYICKKQGQESNFLSNEEKFTGKWYAGYYVSNKVGSYLKDAGQHMSFELYSNGTGKFSIQIDLLEKNETYDLTWSIKNGYCYMVVKTGTNSEKVYVAKLYGDILRLYEENNLTNYYYLCGKITETYPEKFIGLWTTSYLFDGKRAFQVDGNGLEITFQLNPEGTGIYNYIEYDGRGKNEFTWYVEDGLCYITMIDENLNEEKYIIEIFSNNLHIYSLDNLKVYYFCKK